jgi:MFS family permease
VSRPAGAVGDSDFRALWAGSGFSQFATRMAAVAIPLLAVAHLHAGAFAVGVLTALSTLAFLIIGLPAGVIVDRSRQRRLLIGADLGRAALIASVLLAAAVGTVGLAQLDVIAFGTGVLAVFFDVAHQAYLPKIISREGLVAGNTRLTATSAVAQVAGPACAGAAIGAAGLSGTMAIIAAAFAVSAALLVRISAPDSRPAPAPRRHLGREVRAGLAYVLGEPLLRMIALAGSGYNLCCLILQSMVTVRFVGQLGLSAALVSVYFSAGGAGGVLGALAARRLAARIGPYRLIWLALVATGPFALLTPIAENPAGLWLAAGGYFIVSAGAIASNVVQISVRQQLCPPELLGRMTATMRFVLWGSMPLGGLAGGVLGATAGVRAALWVGAAGIVVSCLPLLVTQLRRPVPAALAGAAT